MWNKHKYHCARIGNTLCFLKYYIVFCTKNYRKKHNKYNIKIVCKINHDTCTCKKKKSRQFKPIFSN